MHGDPECLANVCFCCSHFNKMRARSARFNSVAVGSKRRYAALVGADGLGRRATWRLVANMRSTTGKHSARSHALGVMAFTTMPGAQ